MSCILFAKIFTDCLIDDKDFARPGNMKHTHTRARMHTRVHANTQPGTLPKTLMAVNTGAWMKGPNLNCAYLVPMAFEKDMHIG